MKKSIFFVVIFLILNGCAQYSALTGPTYTMAKSGSVLKTGFSYAVSSGIEETLGKSPGEYIQTLVRKNYKIDSLFTQKANERECQTIHTSSLNEIFFETLDEIDCFRDPFSILR